MPMTFDTYSNCSFNCRYCFSQFQRENGKCGEAYRAKQVKSVNVAKVKNMFLNPDDSQFGKYIKERKVMQWGGLSDQFDGYERVNGKTLELLRFFKEINYPLCFSTKSAWWTKDSRYMELFKGQKNWNVKFSIITLDERKARVIEDGVPSPRERLDAIERIANIDAGGATLRLRPFIIGVSSPTYLELIRRAADKGATALSTEFFCIEQRSKALRARMPMFNAMCGFDLWAFYKRYSQHGGYMRLNRKVKEPFVLNMKAECDKVGMRFYVSDAHFKELCCNGSCCGLPSSWNYSRGQFCEALMIAKRKGIVRWGDISKDIELLHSGYLWRKAEGFNTNSAELRAKFWNFTMADWLHWTWNSPKAGQSPYEMFGGILKPIGKDENGDLIYKYMGERSSDSVSGGESACK
jgi:DNA repair photolyase